MPIDFVVTWVDASDPQWQRLRDSYLAPSQGEEGAVRTEDASSLRYRDWGTLRYLFRGIERFAPWVNKVFFITQGHLPPWLNVDCSRLRIVRHEEYVPEKYLPTFASTPLELNLHHLEELSEHFVLFNDDTLLLDKVAPGDFFKGGLPRLVASLEPATVERRTWFYTRVTNASIIDSHFSKHRVIARHPFRWLSPRYPRASLRTLATLPFGQFSSFRERHLPDPYLKSAFARVWEAEPEMLDQTCSHRFRGSFDPNIWLVQDWMLASNEFAPSCASLGKAFFIYGRQDAMRAARYVGARKGKLVCLNDHVVGVGQEEVDACRTLVVDALEAVLPDSSCFER